MFDMLYLLMDFVMLEGIMGVVDVMVMSVLLCGGDFGGVFGIVIVD